MSERRIDQLIQKALDGEITVVEREEMERLLRLHPEARRSLEFWDRFDVAMKEALDDGPRLDVAGMTRRVMEKKDGRSATRWLPKWPRPRLPIPALILGSSLAAFALLVWNGHAIRTPALDRSTAGLGVVVTALADEPEHQEPPPLVHRSPPVEIRIGEASPWEDRPDAPVTIRF